jgi:NADPH:quinone reductase-like Zn-dependent oxidoreductase
MYVITTASPANFDLLKSLGASELIDYHNEKVENRVKDIDVFLDTLGYVFENIIYKKDCAILRKKGKLPSYYIRIASSPHGDNTFLSSDPLGLAIPEARLDRIVEGFSKTLLSKWSLGLSFIKYHFVLVYPDVDALNEIADAMSKGLIKAVIQQKFHMKDASEAHIVLEGGHVVGKLLLVNE